MESLFQQCKIVTLNSMIATSVAICVIAFSLPSRAQDHSARIRDNNGNSTDTTATASATSTSTGSTAGTTATTASTSAKGGPDKTDAGKKNADKDSATADCATAKSHAEAVCNTMSMVGVKDASQGAMLEMLMSQASSMSSTITSTGTNAAAQCALQAKIAEVMAGINAIKGAACATMQSDCVDTCEASSKKATGDTANAAAKKAEAAADDKNVKTCKTYSMNYMMSFMQAVSYGKNYLQDQACADALSAVSATATPITLATAVDCSDATYASSNLTCICASNPTSTVCGGTTGTTLSGTTAALGTSGGSAVPTSLGVTTDGTPAVDAVGKGESGVNASQGGGGGSGLSGGGGMSADLGSQDPGAAAANPQSAITGVSNGGGGSAGSAGGYGAASAPGGQKEGFFDKFNLSKFLPSKKDFKSRGIAGMSVQSKDGITGPMGPSLWEKVSNQYQLQKSKMIQDK